MQTVTELEDSIGTLPVRDFLQLFGWMCEKHLEVLSKDGFESPELEAELLKAVDSPRIEAGDAFFQGLKRRLGTFAA
jgi:hypothetical protein